LTIVEITQFDDSVRQDLHLVHFSVKEYLLKQAQFNIQSASIAISRTCMAYLTDSDDTVGADFPMANYALEYWNIFAVSAETSEEFVRIVLTFLRNEMAFLRCSRLIAEGPLELSNETILYYACLHGLSCTAINLVIQGADINEQVGAYGNALQAASLKGHFDIVQLLIDKGADVNAQVGAHGNALRAASSKGHLKVVQLLLDRGADLNASEDQHGSALYAASFEGQLEVIQLLLDRGADINKNSARFGGALHAASLGGHPEAMQLLPDRGADANIMGGVCGSALQHAMHTCPLSAIQLLLDRGADVNVKGGCHGNPLHAAILKARPKLVQMLLENGADVNAEGCKYINALQAALSLDTSMYIIPPSSRDMLKIVQSLLDKGAEINAQALKMASHKPQIMELLALNSGKMTTKKQSTSTDCVERSKLPRL
jgi:ankyrin repeat protein